MDRGHYVAIIRNYGEESLQTLLKAWVEGSYIACVYKDSIKFMEGVGHISSIINMDGGVYIHSIENFVRGVHISSIIDIIGERST
jgi:hypothetical protein